MEEEKTDEVNKSPNKKSLWVGLILLIIVVVLVIGFWFLKGRSQVQNLTKTLPIPTAKTVQEPVTPPLTQDTTTETQAEVREVRVDGDEFSFSPASISVAAGERIRLTFNNIGTFPHNFMIDELSVATETIPPGSSDTVEFTADQSGTFTFYCSVGNHRAQGMEGSLEIE